MTTSKQPRVSVLVTDLDNTLWDWFGIWHASFSALLEGLAEISGVDTDVLEHEIRTIHQRVGTSEYSHLVQEIPSLARAFPDADLSEVFDDAIHAFRSARKRAMVLYPGVMDALSYIRSLGTTVVAYTESLSYYTSYRLKQFGLDGVIDFLYSPADHTFPEGIDASIMRTGDDDTTYVLQHTEHRETPPGVTKPSPEVLGTIVKQFSRSAASVAYVGDSLMKDVAMAQALGVWDVHANYGEIVESSEYDLLRRVSHWPQDDVVREQAMMAAPDVVPHFVLEHRFDEILRLFDFSAA